MKRGPYLTDEQSDQLFSRITNDGLTIGQLARETGRDKSALYRLFNRRYGHKAGHAKNAAWSVTISVPNDPAILGYIAGIIDGEGSIMKRSDGTWVVKVGMTDEPVMRWLHQFGGTFHVQPLRPPRKQCYHWVVARRRDIVILLNAIKKYLIVKRGSADTALAELTPMVELHD